MRKEEETVEEKCNVESCGSGRGEQGESGNKRHGSGKPNGAQEQGKKRKRDDEEEETRSAEQDFRNEETVGNDKEESEGDRKIEGEHISVIKDHGPPGIQLHVESSRSGRDDPVKYSGEESADDGNTIETVLCFIPVCKTSTSFHLCFYCFFILSILSHLPSFE